MSQGSPNRITAIDLARGIAVSLMILSHGVKGLLSYEQIPHWGLIPIHLMTKFSSTIFFMVFGMSLAVSFVPSTKEKRKKLFVRGIVLLFWYKVLTVIEMSHLHSPDEILNALLYLEFPSYSEILGFYAIALLWVPLILPLWQKSTTFIKALWPLVFAITAWLLTAKFNFFGIPQFKAILVEEPNYYTWGQLSRAPFVFAGMFIGYFLKENYFKRTRRITLTGILTVIGFILFGLFMYLYDQHLYSTFLALAVNEGKHPPELAYIIFSSAGSFIILAFAILIGERGARWLSPLTLIGKDTLTAFVFHITVLFVVYRHLFNFWLNVSYLQALGLTFLLMGMTALCIKLKLWRKDHERSEISRRHISTGRIRSHEPSTN